MGAFAFLEKIFNPAFGEKSPAAVVEASFIKALEDKDKADRDYAQKLIDWYSRDRVAIMKHLTEAARKVFDSTDDWAWPIINGVPRTIRRLSQAYRTAPSRTYWKGDKEVLPDSTDGKKIEKMYSRLNRDRKLRTCDRFATLLNTIHVEAVLRKGFIDWDIRLRPDVTVVASAGDYLSFEKFAYRWAPINPDTLSPVDGWVYWSTEDHVFCSKGGLWVGMSNKEGTNPYLDREGEPLIPITTIRKIEDIADYWGRFGADLVDAAEAENVQLGNFWETMTYQTAGWPLLINCDVQSGAVVKFGPKWPLVAKKITKDDIPPDVKFPKPDPNIEEVRDTLDWFLKMNAAAYGMPPSAWALDEERMSGIAKFLDNAELLENREEELTNWEEIEDDLFLSSVAVWNEHAAEGDRIDREIVQKTEYPPAKIIESPTEKSTRWTQDIAAGLASPVDYYVEEEGLDEEKALEKAIKVAKYNKQIRKAGQERPVAPAFPGNEDRGDEEIVEDEEAEE